MNRRIATGLAPLLLFFAATVGAGLVHAFLQSVSLAGPPASASSGAITFSAYRELFSRTDIVPSMVHSLFVAVVSASLAVSIGAVFAYVLWRSPAWVQAIGSVYHLPIILPHIVVAFVVAVILSPSGIVASLTARLGVDLGRSGFPQLLYDRFGIGIIIAYVYKGFPFVTLMALGVLRTVPERLVITARMLGASRIREFHCIGIPMMRRILNQVFIVLFLYALGGFEIPWLLGSSHPQMLPVTVYSLYFQGSLGDRAVAMAALTVLTVFSALFVVVYGRIVRRGRIRES